MRKYILKVETSVQFFPAIQALPHILKDESKYVIDGKKAYQLFTTKITYIEASEKILNYFWLKRLKMYSGQWEDFLPKKQTIVQSYKLNQNTCYPLLSNKEYWKAWKGYCEFANMYQKRFLNTK